MRERNVERVRAFLISFLVLLGFGLSPSFAISTYPDHYVWDFGDQFNSDPNTSPQALDDLSEVAWKYRGGTYNTDPSLAGALAGWNPTINSNQGAWYGSTAPGSWIGDGFMRACFDDDESGNRFPYLTWVANTSGTVHADINVTDASTSYRARVYLNDSWSILQHSGNASDYSYSQDFTVNPGDTLTLRISSDLPGEDPLVNVGFKVELLSVPEPATLVLVLFGGAGIMSRRRKACSKSAVCFNI
ncbi:MAG: PEP-CTERM sorting domain-containing protein [Phycisphaerae bacterium]